MRLLIWGRDGLGKSTLADYIGLRLSKKSIAVVIDTDLTQPTVPVRIPGIKVKKERSLGRAIAGTGTSEIRPYLIQHPKHEGLFFSGVVSDEDYMEYELGLDSSVNAGIFMNSCASQCDYVIVDCSGQRTDPFLPDALIKSDKILILISPDLQGISWWRSVKPLIDEMKVDHKIIPVISQLHEHHNEKWLQEGYRIDQFVALPFARELNLNRSAGRIDQNLTTRAGRSWQKTVDALISDLTRNRGDGRG
jgi:MinD-like ATPase involved in chromosome partitioning or flagellar assembly